MKNLKILILSLIFLMSCIALYAGFRITQRQSQYSIEEDDYDPVSYANIGFSSTQVAGEVAQELYVDNIEDVNDNGVSN